MYNVWFQEISKPPPMEGHWTGERGVGVLKANLFKRRHEAKL